jgi:hypothetical protein
MKVGFSHAQRTSREERKRLLLYNFCRNRENVSERRIKAVQKF